MNRATYWAAASVIGTVAVTNPVFMYLGSPREFPFLLLDFLLPALLLTSVLVALVGWGVSRLPAQSERRIAALLAATGLALWIQSAFVGWRLGPLDGRSFDWGHGWVAYLDWALWLGLILLPQTIAGLRRRAVIVACCVVPLFAQTGSLVYGIATLEEYRSLKRYDVDASALTSFSSGRNLVFLILDEFQSDVFDELARSEARWKDDFAGFTYFRKALAPAGNTFPSVPEMITGRDYRNSVPVPEYLDSAYRESSLFLELKRQGHRVEVYPGPADTVSLSPRIASNVVPRDVQTEEYLRLFDAGLFRGAPFLLKRRIYRGGDWLTYGWATRRREKSDEWTSRGSGWGWSDLPAFRERMAAATADRTGDLFKFFHLSAMHVPLEYDENLERIVPRYGRDSYARQARGVLGLVADLLARLRELGIYDEAMIVIAADHGSGRSPDMLIAPEGPASRGLDRVRTRAAALLLAKPAGSRGPLRTSDAPVALVDIPATFYAWLEMRPDAVRGASLFSLSEGDRRERHHYSYQWEKPEPLFLNPISEYLVVGDSWKAESWSLERVFQSP